MRMIAVIHKNGLSVPYRSATRHKLFFYVQVFWFFSAASNNPKETKYKAENTQIFYSNTQHTSTHFRFQ